MADKEWTAESIFDVFGDSLARKLLVLLSEEALPVEELTDYLDASAPTIYRRLNTMIDYDLVTEHQEIDEQGHHYRTFETTLKRISLEIEDGGYDVDVTLRRSMVDQFEAFWADFEDASVSGSTTQSRSSGPRGSGDDVHHG